MDKGIYTVFQNCNKVHIKYPTHLTNVATLPCEILMSENSDALFAMHCPA